MADSSTEIANLAISHLGIGKEIANIASDNSNEANACRRFYDTARDKVLGDFNWPFARKFAELGLVEADPTDEWAYSYRYPSDALKLRRILSGVRNDNRQSRVPYIVGQDDTGKLIYTDQQEAQMEYTKLITNVTFFSADFVVALSYLLAAYITPRIMGSDRFKMIPGFLQMYQAELMNAQANAANEQQDDLPVESEFIRERDGVNSFDDSRSFLPF